MTQIIRYNKLLLLYLQIIFISIPNVTSLQGGEPAMLGDIPYHIQVRIKVGGSGDTQYVCGATLVLNPYGSQIVLTHRECVTKNAPSTALIPAKDIVLIGGRILRDGHHVFEQTRGVEKIEFRTDWSRKFRTGISAKISKHAIVIIKLDKEFDVNRLVQPIALPFYTDVFPKAGKLIISGWGETTPMNQDLAEHLQVSTIDYVDHDRCNSVYYDIYYVRAVPSVSFCLGKIKNPTRQGMCIGDQGGPAASFENGTIYLAGIFDWGEPTCGNRYNPTVYINVADYMRWILKYSNYD